MNMIRYNNPWNFLDQLNRGHNSPFANDLGDESGQSWAPAVDIHEDDANFK